MRSFQITLKLWIKQLIHSKAYQFISRKVKFKTMRFKRWRVNLILSSNNIQSCLMNFAKKEIMKIIIKLLLIIYRHRLLNLNLTSKKKMQFIKSLWKKLQKTRMTIKKQWAQNIIKRQAICFKSQEQNNFNFEDRTTNTKGQLANSGKIWRRKIDMWNRLKPNPKLIALQCIKKYSRYKLIMFSYKTSNRSCWNKREFWKSKFMIMKCWGPALQN